MPGTKAVEIRPGRPEDLSAIARVQAASPEASQWPVSDYLGYDLLVAVRDGAVAGFLVSRSVAPDERELLNLAVDPAMRRTGAAKSLVHTLQHGSKGTIFLEVRASNQSARNLYKSMGFQEFSARQNYYDNPLEAAIVMKFHSC